MTGLRIEVLGRHHSVEGFDCGREALNRFLLRHALPNQSAHSARTYVATAGAEVAGYYSLVVGEVAYAEAAERLKKGLAQHPIPVMLLARLAIRLDWQGQGLGAGLLKDAMIRTAHAAQIAGIRAMVVHAKDEPARAFYAHFGFQPSPSDPLHLFMLVKDIARAGS